MKKLIVLFFVSLTIATSFGQRTGTKFSSNVWVAEGLKVGNNGVYIDSIKVNGDTLFLYYNGNAYYLLKN